MLFAHPAQVYDRDGEIVQNRPSPYNVSDAKTTEAAFNETHRILKNAGLLASKRKDEFALLMLPAHSDYGTTDRSKFVRKPSFTAAGTTLA